MTALSFENLTIAYDRHPAVHHLDAKIDEGSLLAIVGPNGGGKSTLLKAIAGQHRPAEGRINLGGLQPSDIAYLPQQAELDRRFPATVFDVVAMGLWRRIGLLGAIRGELVSKVAQAIAAVGLEGFERRPIGSLSGGQLQRTLFARLLVQDAGLILLDEPFNAIDAKTVQDLLGLIQRWHGEKRTVLVVLYDLETVRSVFPETLYLAREPIAFGPTADALHPENQLRARRMGEAFDDQAAICQRLAS